MIELGIEPTSNNMSNKMSKSDILDLIQQHDYFKKIIKVYRDNDCEAHVYPLTFDIYSKPNGLVRNIYVFTLKDKIVDIIVPIITSEKTSTWDFKFNKYIKDSIDDIQLEESDITHKAKAVVFYIDNINKEVTLLSMLKVSDWINNGRIGYKNKNTVFFYNDNPLKRWSYEGTAQLRSEVFVKALEHFKSVEIMQFCREYAKKQYKKFNNDGSRDASTMIKHIGKGLYAQIKIYLNLKKSGHNVSMEWLDGDDLGVDITYHLDDYTKINIDVKSTSNDILKIAKFRKETDYYAIIQWDKTTPVLLGFINKFSFWESKLLGTSAPVKDEETNLYTKKLTKKWQKEFLSIDQLADDLKAYNMLKIKSKQSLFKLD